jgi:biotin-(acetyl-CoA carboxylase) ligase
LESVPEYKHKIRKEMKRVHKENPQMTKEEIYKNHRGDPVIAKFHPQRYFGAISEKIDDQLKTYVEKDSYNKKIEELGA